MSPTIENWLKSLMAACIGASANAVTLIIVDPLKFNFTRAGFASLAEAMAVSAIVSAAMFLKQSPLPSSAAVVQPPQK